jgi:hypothetical protein
MAYKRREDGRFRLRASFDIPADVVEGLNEISSRTGLSVASLCLFAVQRLIADGEQQKGHEARTLSVTAGGEA